MINILALINKNKSRTNDEIKAITSYSSYIYPNLINNQDERFVEFSPQTILDHDQWFYIKEFSTTQFAPSYIKASVISTSEYDLITKNDISNINYIIIIDNNESTISFQNVTKSKLIKRKSLLWLDNGYQYSEPDSIIQLNELPDAVYSITDDCLYFRNILTIKSIFPGIDSLLREATDDECEKIFKLEIVSQNSKYNPKNASNTLRRMIPTILEKINQYSDEDKKKLFKYIRENADLNIEHRKVVINSAKEFRTFVNALDERFYKTQVKQERRLANSIINLDSK